MRGFTSFCLAVVVVAVFASASSAQIGIVPGVRGGLGMYSVDTTSYSGPAFGINVNMAFMPMLSAQLFAEYWMHSESEEAGTVSMDIKMTDIPIGVHLLYNIDIPGSPIRPYVGAGPSFHLMSTKTTTTVADVESDTTVSKSKIGIGGCAGAEFMATPQLGIFLELKDHYILTAETETIAGVDYKSKNTNAMYIMGGINYHLK
jgi:outer membrane protein W